MSLRRKSCDACFSGRRKCDREYPVCGTCRRTKKSCHYVYAPVSSASLPDGSMSRDTGTADGFVAHPDNSFLGLWDDEFGSTFARESPVSDAARPLCGDSITPRANPGAPSPSSTWSNAPPTRPRSNIPSFLGGLGEVQRVEGSTDSWSWVIGELKRCPSDLATRGETLFLHKNLYRDAMPRAIWAALGTSAAFCMLQEDKRHLLFRALDAEVLELLRTGADENQGPGCVRVFRPGGINDSNNRLTLLDELARLQAIILYQMMRVFGGGLEHRIVVEQQRDLVTTWALQLLRRSMTELGSGSHRAANANSDMDSWQTWVVAESIRRTVMVTYMFYGVYSLAKRGFCVELPTLAKLPVSKAPASWHSEAAYLAQRGGGEAQQTLTYEEFTNYWIVSPPERVDPFDKFLVVPCKGLEAVPS